jgi:proteasome lid subunit RPN8/RPN11
MPTLWITPAQVEQIVQHALDERPNEACGLVLGADRHVSEVIRAVNDDTEPHRRFRIDDASLATYGHTAIGFYHSHPQGHPLPSRSDIQESCYPEHVHLIVGLKRSPTELAAWRFDHERVERVALHISNQPPMSDEPPPTTAQKAAIVLAVALGMIIVVVVAWTLLPAAPPIP